MLPYQSLCRSAKPLRRYRDLTVFQNGGRSILDFENLKTITAKYPADGQSASPCKKLATSLKRLRRNRDFSSFQDGGESHVEFSKKSFLTAGGIWRLNMCYLTFSTALNLTRCYHRYPPLPTQRYLCYTPISTIANTRLYRLW